MHFRESIAVIAVLASCVLVGLAPQSAWCAAPGALRAGAAKVDITPTDLTGIVSVWAKPFESVHDPIFARALVVDNSAASVAIVSTDLVEFGNTLALRQRIEREIGIKADHVIIAASHDHNAPRGGPPTPGTSSAEGRPASPPAYTQFIDDQIVETVRRAKASLQPARFGVGRGRADVNVNRIIFTPQRIRTGVNLDGPSDKTVWVVKFESLSGEPIALLLNYAVHSVVAGSGNPQITGDLAGAVERYVERQFQGKVVALWTMGPAGDQNPRVNLSVPGMGRSGDQANDIALSYEAMEAQGLLIGAEAVRVAGEIGGMSNAARIVAAERVFSCATKPTTIGGRPGGGGGGPVNPGPPQPRPEQMDVRLSLILIDKLAITSVSGEVFTNIYLRLKKASPFTNMFMITIANDRIGYIADSAHYEVTGDPLVRGCGEEGIVNNLLEMMEQLSRQP